MPSVLGRCRHIAGSSASGAGRPQHVARGCARPCRTVDVDGSIYRQQVLAAHAAFSCRGSKRSNNAGLSRKACYKYLLVHRLQVRATATYCEVRWAA
jgi:hypothetical protein